MTRGERAHVLVVDDNRFHRELARQALSDTARVECCESGEQALERLSQGPVDLVLTDLTMPGLSGLDLLARVQRSHPGTDVVLVTAHASIDSAVHALRAGATDYLQKPVRADDLILVVERTMARRALVEENRKLRDERAVLEACKSLTPCLEPEDVYAVALDLALGAAGRRSGLALYRRTSIGGSDGLQCRGLHESVELPLRKLLAGDKPFDLGALVRDAAEGSVVWERGPLLESLARAGIETESVLVLSLRGEDTELGLMVLFDEGRAFDASEGERAEWVQGHANISLRNAERYRRARDRAFVDDVTELYNARYLSQAMEREVQRSERYGSELSVLFIDLDRFKLVNDNHSHLVGTEALRELSRVLARVRPAGRHPGALRRRRVHDPAGGHPPEPGHGGGRADPGQRGQTMASRRRRGRPSTSPAASGSPRIRSTGAPARACSRPPTRRCTGPSPTAAIASAPPRSWPSPALARGRRLGAQAGPLLTTPRFHSDFSVFEGSCDKRRTRRRRSRRPR